MFGVFGGDAALDGRAVQRDIRLLGKRKRRRVQGVPFGNANLRLHEVDAGDHFGDGVLDLDARIDFDEVPAIGVGIEEEFDGAGVAVAGFARQGDGRAAEFLADRGRQMRRGGDFDHFLVAALHGTVAFPQMQQIAVMIAQDLNLDVAGAGDVFFEEYGGVAECRERFVLRFLQARVEIGGLAHHAHPSPSAAHGGFDDDRVADVLSELAGFSRGFDGRFRSGQNRHSGGSGQTAGGRLVAEKFEQFGRWADEGDTGLGAGTREAGVLRQEAVSGMDGVNLALDGQGDDARDVEIGFDGGLAFADQVGLVGLETVQAEAIFLGIDGDGTQVQLGGGAKDADGDLAAVGRQQPANRTNGIGRSAHGVALSAACRRCRC